MCGLAQTFPNPPSARSLSRPARSPRGVGDECRDDEQRERRVQQRKHPGRQVVEQEFLQPVADEAQVVAGLAGLSAQAVFDDGERAGDAEPGLGQHKTDGAEVGEPQPRVSRPAPAARPADQDQYQTANDERYEQRMQRQHAIGQPPIDLRRHDRAPAALHRAR